MKLLIESWRRYINEAIDLICPPATQDLKLNTKNRDSAIHARSPGANHDRSTSQQVC